MIMMLWKSVFVFVNLTGLQTMMQSPRVNQSRIQCIKVKPDLLCLKQFEF